MPSRRPLLGLLALTVLLAACGGGGGPGQVRRLTIVINAPFSRSPYVAETIARGVELGARDSGPAAAGGAGGFDVGGTSYELRLLELDNRLSPRQALRNVRRAAAEGAIAIVDEGTGVDGTWPVAREAGIPIGIVYQGGIGLVDPVERPNVFRIAPTDHGIAFRLAEYLIPKGLKIALLHDDTDYGQQGRQALDAAFATNAESVATRLVLPSGQTDLAPQILRARRAGATALIVWARGPTIANALVAARSRGWDVPF
ncbi:MAG: ABC transporter substrate-binding protein, partial [Gaiellaceae bacterium]